MKFWGVSLRTDGFPTVSLDQFQWLKVGPNWVNDWTWLFPVTVGYLEGKTKENLHDNGKKNTTSWRCISPHFSLNGDFPAFASHVSKTAGRRWARPSLPRPVVVPLPNSADFSSYATPGRSPKALSCPPGARPRDPGDGAVGPMTVLLVGVGLCCVFGLGPQKRLEET